MIYYSIFPCIAVEQVYWILCCSVFSGILESVCICGCHLSPSQPADSLLGDDEGGISNVFYLLWRLAIQTSFLGVSSSNFVILKNVILSKLYFHSCGWCLAYEEKVSKFNEKTNSIALNQRGANPIGMKIFGPKKPACPSFQMFRFIWKEEIQQMKILIRKEEIQHFCSTCADLKSWPGLIC